MRLAAGADVVLQTLLAAFRDTAAVLGSAGRNALERLHGSEGVFARTWPTGSMALGIMLMLLAFLVGADLYSLHLSWTAAAQAIGCLTLAAAIVALILGRDRLFPDNWIYIHTPGVKVGRIQNFGRWSPYMVKDGRTCLGLEFFVNEGDHMWTKHDDDLVDADVLVADCGKHGLLRFVELQLDRMADLATVAVPSLCGLRGRGERTELLQNVIDRFHQLRAVFDQRVATARHAAVDRSGHGEHFAALLVGVPGGDQGAGAVRGLDDDLTWGSCLLLGLRNGGPGDACKHSRDRQRDACHTCEIYPAHRAQPGGGDLQL